MMKFSRPYERSVLVYREQDGARILLRLGRTFDNGECIPDEGTDLPEGFEFLTYILSKDSEALLRDISSRFEEYLDSDMGSYDGAVFDALKLQNRIEQEMASGAGSDLLGGLERVYGKQVVEILFEATFGNDISLAKRAARLAKTGEAKHDFPAVKIALVAFAAIVALPLLVTYLVNPDAINLSDPDEAPDRGLLLEYADTKSEVAATLPLSPEQSAAQRIFEEARVLKQDFYLTLGEPNQDQELVRPLRAEPDDQNIAQKADISQSGHDPSQPSLELDATKAGSQGDTNGPGWSAEDALKYGYPLTFAGFALRDFQTYSTGAATSGPDLGSTGVYEVARGPGTIFDVKVEDLDGFAEDLDKVAAGLCTVLLSTQSDLAAAGLNVQLGKSDFITTILDAAGCQSGSYTLYPSFEFRLPPQEE